MWGANVVRLATYSAEEGGYATETGDRAALNDLVVRGVQYAQAADLYAVVDWHTLSDANPLTNQWAAEEFFRSVSGALGDADNVIYEICNEPNGSTSWADIKAYAEAVIPIIRTNDPDAVIVVGTPTWSQDLAAAAADPLPDANVMYALHFYAATHEDDLRRAFHGGGRRPARVRDRVRYLRGERRRRDRLRFGEPVGAPHERAGCELHLLEPVEQGRDGGPVQARLREDLRLHSGRPH